MDSTKPHHQLKPRIPRVDDVVDDFLLRAVEHRGCGPRPDVVVGPDELEILGNRVEVA